jgi:tRNA/rRNA methyltransferase
MAGTDHRRARPAAAETEGEATARPPQPAVVLVAPQMGENIGTAARAMLNFALGDLRLVRPRDGWPNIKAVAAASGATEVLDSLRVFDRTEDAIADLQRVYATTARPRHLAKPVVTAHEAAREMRAEIAAGRRVGVLFGPERTGLDNDDVVLADAVLTVPLNPGFSSLNLAQAVLLVAYEWFQAADEMPPPRQEPEHGSRPATREELVGLFEHLERELDEVNFFRAANKRASLVGRIRSILLRAELREADVHILRGIVADLTDARRRRRRKEGGS